MEIKQAIQLIGELVDEECQRLALNANMFLLYDVESLRPMAEKRARLRQAKSILFALVGYPDKPRG